MPKPGPSLARLLEVIGERRDPPTPASQTDERILDACVQVLGELGPEVATMDDVARASGINRATLFRRFGGKDALFQAALARELYALLDRLAEVFLTVTDPTEQVVEGFTEAMKLATEHVIFRDPASRAVLVRWLSEDPTLLRRTHAQVTTVLARGPGADPAQLADVFLHVTLGYLAAPSVVFDLRDEAQVRGLARTLLAPLLSAPPVTL
ncbi:TetR/AcrR family transcriptional regulator [Nocardioides sp. zg-536]|uniref:TetR/AcrR family transcriptional regulator n=1 Tax=Nocardioides faecalis TaxID=2803858 RepID=A0A939BY62_9ACTN|nr:TetR/AcrR family transcriptional regulator [Nocardioides faecalis]MBM9460018.1 TetR/AcrR family transcriptional regulator [Nocardioides faecalis]MBS4753114.1 TetR/AcrR family transcriptional regulator [Nocardioides faecalis]QVI58761.1 TetR/AcrR family transcriptional regulator [Nocardioides faecalis]